METKSLQNGQSKPTRVSRECDAIQTHCGFAEPKRPFGDMVAVNRACDRFFATRGMIWIGGDIQDYVHPVFIPEFMHLASRLP